MTPTIITLAQARERGLTWYFTGESCKHGHTSKRRVATRGCMKCAALKRRIRESAQRARKRRACVICGALFRPKTNAKTCCYAHLRQWRNRKNKSWKANNPEKASESAIKGTKKWRLANIEHLRAYEKQRKRDRTKVNASIKRWRIANRDRVNTYVNKRRMLKRAVGGHHTSEEAIALLKAQRYRCALCRADLRKARRHRDHIIPISKGGTDDIRNIQWLCVTCNTRKHNKDPLDFSRENGLLL